MEEEKTENFQVVVENRDIEQIGQQNVEYVIPENFSLDGDETFIIETDNLPVSVPMLFIYLLMHPDTKRGL